MKRLDRLLGMALLLSARRRLRAEDLAQSFRVSLRTVYRDLRSLQESGFSVVGTPGDGYHLPEQERLRPLSLASEEAEALVMAARLLETTADEKLRERLQAATAKIEAVLSPLALRRLRDHRHRVRMVPSSRKERVPLGLLLDAVNERKVLSIEYDGVARGERTTRRIEPLGMVRFDHVWLVVAYCRLREDLRVFRADRIAVVTETNEHYEPRKDRTFEDYVRERTDATDTKSASGGPRSRASDTAAPPTPTAPDRSRASARRRDRNAPVPTSS